MRRQFQSDEEIPACVWQAFPEFKQKLNRIIEIEDRLVSAINSRKRICYAINSEPDFKTKILRVHLRHQFHPSTASDRAHYVITVEGHLLDKSIAKQSPFGNFLDKLRLQLDKRFHPNNNVYEWSADSFPEGAKGQCFRVKVYGDKPFPIKVFLYRSNDIRARYELSPNLREILPSMQVDPTEEQVLLALWTSLTTNNMMDGRDRRQVKCSPELKNLFGVEALSLATLRHKVSEHLLPARAIQVEYNVTNVSSSVTTSFGPNAVSKGGGKAFDVEVEVKDPYAFDLLECVNDISRSQKEIMETISTMEQKASFLASAIIDSSNSIFSDLEKLQCDPLSLSLPFPLSPNQQSHSQSDAGCARDRFMDPLLITARGESSGFAMRPSLPTELLQRAAEPFSLISRRSVPSTAAAKKIMRPQRGPNTDNSRDSVLSGESGRAEEASSSSSHSRDMEGVKDEEEEREVCGADGGGGTDAADALPSTSAPTSFEKTEDDPNTASGSSEMDVVPAYEDMKDDEMVVDEPLGGDLNSSVTLTATQSVGHDRQDEDKEFALPATIKEEKEGELEKEGEEEPRSSSTVKEEGRSDVPHAVKKEEEKEAGGEGIVNLVPVKGEALEQEQKKEKVKEIDTSDRPSTPSDTTTEPVKLKSEAPSVPAIKAELAPLPAPIAPPKPEMLSRAPDNLSAIHSLRGFLDVGSAALFAPSEPWVLATASLLAKRKLSKSSR